MLLNNAPGSVAAVAGSQSGVLMTQAQSTPSPHDSAQVDAPGVLPLGRSRWLAVRCPKPNAGDHKAPRNLRAAAFPDLAILALGPVRHRRVRLSEKGG
jgi:hypothetical protein